MEPAISATMMFGQPLVQCPNEKISIGSAAAQKRRPTKRLQPLRLSPRAAVAKALAGQGFVPPSLKQRRKGETLKR
jgi:hypothetical protein